YCFRYGSGLVGTAQELADPELVYPPKYSPDALDEVRRHIVWQHEHNEDSLNDALDHFGDNEWHDGVKDLLHGQSHNPPVQQLYPRYFPEVGRYAAWRLNRRETLTDPEFESA